MRKLLLSAFILLFTFSFSACTDNDSAAVTSSTLPVASDTSTGSVDTAISEATTISDITETPVSETTEALPAATLTVTMPAGWTVVADTTLPAQYTKGTASFLVTYEYYLNDMTLDDTVTYVQETFSGAFSNVTYGETSVLTISGKDARHFSFTCTVLDMSMTYDYYYVNVDGRIYSVVFGDVTDGFAANVSPDIPAVLAGIVFA